MGFVSKLLFAILLVSVGFNAFYFSKNQQPEAKPATVIVGEPIVMHTNGGALEVSTVKVVERYEQASVTTILGIPVPSTEIVATFQAPVTYRYQVLLAPEWQFFKRDNVFVVIAPPVKPALPVAFDTTGLQVFSRGIWSPITGRAAIDGLVKQITPLLEGRANSSGVIETQRNEARKAVGEFVQKWVLSQDKWKNLTGVQIQVFFADESPETLKAAGYGVAPYKL